MANIETLDYETKLCFLICGLWALDLSDPTMLENIDHFSLMSINNDQNLGKSKFKFVKFLSERCKNLQSQKITMELINSLQEITLLNNKNSDFHELVKINVIKNYIRRFKLFYLCYFNKLDPQYFTQKDFNTIAISILFFLII